MRVLDWLLGRHLATAEQAHQEIGPLWAVPLLGLDALASAAYGPEAALTLLRPLGPSGTGFMLPITGIIVAILLLVCFSYRQTIAAYPGGGGSFTVAQNMGKGAGLLAGAALFVDYVLNVAVAIAAGVGALVSAVPGLLPHTLALCLAALALLTIVNLRGVRESARLFAVPTYTFVVALGGVILFGVVKTVLAGGHPTPVTPPPAPPPALEAVSWWILARAFANGCTAMTGVEAVSNAVPLFRQPKVIQAQRTLALIIAILVLLLAGLAILCRAYQVCATEPGRAGYESVLSIVVRAVAGRGLVYYVTMGAIVAVLTLSANTSFAAFPRLCRLLAGACYLPSAFASRGRRLVYTPGILLLAALSAALLVVFRGITERLIPLFAVGALLAFTMSQAGMVVHWHRAGRGRHSLLISAAGAVATGLTAVAVAVTKFTEGAWLTVIVIPALVLFFHRVHRHHRRLTAQIASSEPAELPSSRPPLAVLAASSWNRMTRAGLKLAMHLSPEVFVVQVRTETDAATDLSEDWERLIGRRVRAAGLPEPRLVVLTSAYRQFFQPFVDFVLRLEAAEGEREIAVVIPELVTSHWWERLLRNNRGAILRMRLLVKCSSRVVVVHTSYHVRAG